MLGFFISTLDPVRILEGYPIGANGDRAFCSACRRELRAGHVATVTAYRFVETNQWDVSEVRCSICAPTHIEDPTPGAVEVLASGALKMGQPFGGESGRLHLTNIDIIGFEDAE